MRLTHFFSYTHLKPKYTLKRFRQPIGSHLRLWEAFMGRYEGGSLFLEKHWYLLIKFYSTLQSAASYELWANCGVCVCVRACCVCGGGQRPFCS